MGNWRLPTLFRNQWARIPKTCEIFYSHWSILWRGCWHWRYAARCNSVVANNAQNHHRLQRHLEGDSDEGGQSDQKIQV